MKIIAIISNQAFSLVNFRGPLISSLRTAGVGVLALAPDYDDDLRNQVKYLGAEPVDYSLSRTGMNPFRDLVDMVRLVRLLYRLRPDVSFGYFIKPVIYGTLAAWIARVPTRVVMIAGLGFVFTDSGGKQTVKRKLLLRAVAILYRISLKRAHQVVFQNTDDLKEFVDRKLVDEKKVVCVRGSGVELTKWRPVPPVMEPITFILVGRLLYEKGVIEFIEASKRVKARFPKIRCVLLGGLDSNPGTLSRCEVESWVHEGFVEWPGHVPVQPWLEQASVFVLPSYREGVPRSTQEAMAMARPIITTDVPGCRETIIDGENGILIPVRSIKALEEAMIYFIEHPDEIKSMGLKSRELAEARFNVREINHQMLNVMGFNKDVRTIATEH